ncbi:hypothetical protein QU926_20700 [Pseudomonas asiatica]|uniref:hypothetical protein n=1 Tax=Pseudomonas asiatica TaxID=2219225 RepID=UPI0025AA51E9|nr:hypothetical protein [Pseudomonas asiatica]MDM9556036.1 hypothetical protein [Pseudomonas asiatica]
MSIHELLELAAKAAGYEFYDISLYGGVRLYGEGREQTISSDGRPVFYWDPITDDGDAFRLAVKLHMSLEMFTGGCEVRFDDMRGGEGFLEQNDGEGDLDDNALTRLAIVRAAAEMEKATQEGE